MGPKGVAQCLLSGTGCNPGTSSEVSRSAERAEGTTPPPDDPSMEMPERPEGISTHLTLVNFLKGMIGSGILTLPIVFRQAGLWTAFGLVFLFGALNGFTMHMLVRCAHHHHLLARHRQKRTKDKTTDECDVIGPLSYGQVMYVAVADSFPWARPHAGKAKLFVNATIVVLQMGIGVLKYDFIVAHLRELFSEFTSFHASTLLWALLIFPPMVLLNWVRSLRHIAMINSVGNLFMFGAYGTIFYHLLQSPHETARLPWLTNPSGVLSACGSILYCFEGQAMVLPMENKMRHPGEMTNRFGVLATGMALTAIFDASVGFLGYAKFGEAIQGSVTLNLPVTPLLTIVKLIFTAIAFLDFLLQQYVTIQMLWPPLRRRLCGQMGSAAMEEDRSGLRASSTTSSSSSSSSSSASSAFVYCCEYLFRAGLVAITMLISVFVPNLEQIMPLVGFSGGVFLAFVFPPLIDTFTFVPNPHSRHRWRLARNSFFVLIGLFGSFAGLKTSLEDIFRHNTN